ncbi:MAG: helix-turn-helix transcriptional regulator [Halioglobus sp.]
MTPSPHIDLQSLILFFGTCQAGLFVILLAFKQQPKRVINFHIAILLFAISAEVGHQFLLQTHYIYQVPLLAGCALPLDALVGISIYWYVRIITHPELDHSATRVLAHYSLFFFCVLLSVPYWRLGFEQKLSLMQTGVVPTDWPPLAYYSTVVQTPIKIFSFIAYIVLSVRLLLRHRQRIASIFSYREKVTLNWLSALLALFIFGLLNGLGVLLFFQEYTDSTQIMGFMGVFSLIAILYLGVMGLMQPAIYLREEQSYLERQHEEANDYTEPGKYQNSSLSPGDMQRIATKLSEKLASEKLYLDSSLSMPKLAESIGVSPNYVSQTINSVFNASFFDYINGLRVNYAKSLLSDPSYSHLSVVDVAMESAFNSRSTFYSAFKQATGQTPAQFRKSACGQATKSHSKTT